MTTEIEKFNSESVSFGNVNPSDLVPCEFLRMEVLPTPS